MPADVDMRGTRKRLGLCWRAWKLCRQRRWLEVFLDARIVCAPSAMLRPGDIEGWIGWGRRPSGLCASRRALGTGVPPYLLEDGFLRSLGLGRQGNRPLSLVVDTIGMHYDATAPSAVEVMLNEGVFTPEELQRARKVIKLLRERGLSKYNDGLPVPPGFFRQDRERVLVVDQTAGDRSIELGMADEATFRNMLEAALDENPGAEIIIKKHPDVIAGLRPGCLPDIRDRRVRIIAENWHPHDLLQHVSKVYLATSLMGLDALLLGKKVHCFGMPFYAGWGLTTDFRQCSRRQTRRSLEELVAAAFLRYARYVDPLTGKKGRIEDVIAHLARQKEGLRFWADQGRESWSGRVFAFGFRLWKQAQTRPFFGEGVRVVHVRSMAHARRHGISPADRVAVWGLKDPPELQALVEDLGVPLVRVEDGFLRSVGLGADFIPPMSLVFDTRGIYFDPSSPSDLETLLNETRFSPEVLREAARLRHIIVRERLTKYILPAGPCSDFRKLAGGRRIVLVPGQVANDASIIRGAPVVRDNLQLLEQARREEPEAFIVYKPHPDVMAGNRKGALHLRQAARFCDHVETRADIISCIEQADVVHTMTSLSGFDALLRGRAVVCHGLPFYAGWGLTDDRLSLPRRRRRLSLDELVAGSLLLYPRYVWGESGFVPALAVARELAAQRRLLEQSGGSGWRRLRKWAWLARGLASSALTGLSSRRR